VISIPLQSRCVVRIPPTDFRCGIDGLVRLVRVLFQEDPFTGTVFVFVNRGRTAVKLLFYDGQGWWLALKRLSQGKLQWWPKAGDASLEIGQLSARELQVLIWNGSPKESQFSSEWKQIAHQPTSQET
jgi:transposase